jgi:hypothetical protein
MFNKVEEAKVAREVLDFAGVSVEQFCDIEAASDRQRDFALDLMIKAVERGWTYVNHWYPHIKQDVRFARALVCACMEHRQSAWWCKKKSTWQFGNVVSELGAEIKRFLDEEPEAEDDGSSSAEEKIIDFGVRQGLKISECSPEYLRWAASHEAAYGPDHKWVSIEAKKLLESRKEVQETKKAA